MAEEPVLPFFKIEERSYAIPDELARELAGIVIQWSGLENAVTIDIEQLRAFPVVRALSDVIPGTFDAKLKLWRRAYATLFPTVKAYNDLAEDIFGKIRLVGRERHRLIYGVWSPVQDQPGTFTVMAGLDRRKDIAYFQPNMIYLTAVHQDIKKLSDGVWSLNASRQIHAVQGRLQRQPGPSGEHRALQPPPTPEKP